jgi:hypothetical protein
VLILVAYAAAQFGLLGQTSRVYLALKLVGSLILAVLAWNEERLGFLLLEGVWALVSAWSLIQLLRGRQPAGSYKSAHPAQLLYALPPPHEPTAPGSVL